MNVNQQENFGQDLISNWMTNQQKSPFEFQTQTWKKYAQSYSGLVIAPTGLGKTYSVFFAVLADYLNQPTKYKSGLKLLWVSPLRSLAKDLQRAMQEALDSIGLDWVVEVRNGDIDQKTRQQQIRKMPDVLIVTPESLHLLFAQKNHVPLFNSLRCIAVDEWHELLGNKRGVLTELAISRLKSLQPDLRIWGISATIGNLDEALEVLVPYEGKKTIVRSKIKKKTNIHSVLPKSNQDLPWAGHMGTQMAPQIVPIIEKSKTTLLFTNTRHQAEMWYQFLLRENPEFAGQMAIHHGSIDKHLRVWIEEALSNGSLKAVISTSSLDLGVDFKPVDTVVQIGSVKGVARFLQRAGRSGHSPFEDSNIYFVPTHSLELVEVSALKQAVKENVIESRTPVVLAFDVLIQYLVTLAVGPGFKPDDLYDQIKSTYSFQWITEDEWSSLLNFITQGGESFKNYDDFKKVDILEDGTYKVTSRRVAMLHRMNIGVIVSDTMVKVRLKSGGYLGMVEEYFVSRLKPGEKFILAGQVLEFVQLKEMTCYVKKSSGASQAPSYMGGRLPLTSDLSHFLRKQLSESLKPKRDEPELSYLHPLLSNQDSRSHIPKANEFLIEQIETKDGHHLFFYPFEGRLVHEVMSALFAYRISKYQKLSFSMAMNDYGFELLSNQPIELTSELVDNLLTKTNLMNDVVASVNATEMASRKFRDIAVIAGLVIQNLSNKQKNFKSLQSSSSLIFQVLEEYEPNHLLVRQAYSEVFNQQFEEVRLKAAFDRIEASDIVIRQATDFTPLSLPIKVDGLRSSMSNEDLQSRIEQMQRQMVKA